MPKPLPFLRTLRSRLIASHLLVALAGILLISALAGSSIYRAARRQIEDQYAGRALAAGNGLEQPLLELRSGGGSSDTVNQVVQRWFDGVPGLRYGLFAADGTPLASNAATLPGPLDMAAPEVQAALQPGLGDGRQIRNSSQGEETLFLAVRIGQAEKLEGILRLEIPVQSALAPARRSLVLLALTGLAISLVLGASSYALARALSTPIRSLTQTAERLSQGDLAARAEVPPGPVELHRLAEAVNTMAAQVQTSLDELRGFVANASHELRTPLTVVKLRVEALRAGALEDKPVADRFLSEIESEVDRLSRTVSDLLDLSRIEAGLAGKERTPLDLGTLAGEVCEVFNARAERLGVTLNLEVQPRLPQVLGNEDQLRRVLYNLVDNAIKYTTRGGRVDVTLRDRPGEAWLELMVKDTGFGIDPKHLAHVFERFYRVEATRPRYGTSQGSGLGLSIAKSIVETHGGRINVSSKLREGTTFLIELPVKKG